MCNSDYMCNNIPTLVHPQLVLDEQSILEDLLFKLAHLTILCVFLFATFLVNER